MFIPKQVPLQSIGDAMASMQSLHDPVDPIGVTSPGQFVRLRSGNVTSSPQNPGFTKFADDVGPQAITFPLNGLDWKKESRFDITMAPFPIRMMPCPPVERVVKLFWKK